MLDIRLEAGASRVHPASPPGQASGVVFVQNRKATVNLTATVHPGVAGRCHHKGAWAGAPLGDIDTLSEWCNKLLEPGREKR